MSVAYERLLELAGDAVVRRHDGWAEVRCPAHDDHNPSLTIGIRTTGRPGAWVKCQAGCPTPVVLAELDAPSAGLYDDHWEQNANGNGTGGPSVLVATYSYVDERSSALFEVGRFEPGWHGKRKTFAQRQPGAPDWRGGIKGVRRVLYRLPRVLAAVKAGETVWVAEGEEDVHALERAGAVATTNPAGAGKWRDEYSGCLRGATVVIVADRDTAGRDHAQQVRASLDGVAASVRVVEAAVGKDARDHLAAGRPLDAFSEAPEEEGAVPALPLVTLEEFTDGELVLPRALLGSTDNAVIPEGADVMIYGDGGAGKTTLSVDLACHLAAGDDWFGMHVEQPVRVLMIENEGPRPFFQRKLQRKRQAWAGSGLDGRICVPHEDWPWASFTFAEETHRQALATTIRARAIDVVIIGPLTRAGMEEAGTLQQTRDFMRLLADVRQRAGRTVVFVVIHHENKNGGVSGAWEGAADTLMHVQGQGNGRTRLHFQKTRWASSSHGKTLQLAWTDGEGFELSDEPERDDNTIADEILEYVRGHGGAGWNDVDEAVPGQAQRKREIRTRLLAGERLVNVGSDRNMSLWHVDDPACPAPQEPLRPDRDAPGTHPTSAPGVDEVGGASQPPASRRDGGRGRTPSAPPPEPAEGPQS